MESIEQERTRKKPNIGITIGDFNGVGPELIIKILQDTRINNICTPIIYGSGKILTKYKRLLDIEQFNYHQYNPNSYLNEKKPNVINCWQDNFEVNPGKVTKEAGKCAFLALEKATEDLKSGFLDGLVTCPINKSNIQSEEFKFPGHTEYLATKMEVKENLMLLCSDTLRVAVVTGHVPVSQIKITKEAVHTKLTLLYESLKKDFGISRPKIAVLGLNPHAGEEGLLGSEDKEIIQPVITEFHKKGKLVYGPFPADGFFGMYSHTKFDAVLAMYHDQGLIPFKTLAFEKGVNFTAGMPTVRTSPDHGTAYDIAGKGIASEVSLR
jgi:4-hydroxythreonine-4-phosphate dehydrogenase